MSLDKSCPKPGQHGIAKTMNDGEKIVKVLFIDKNFYVCEELETRKEYKIYREMFTLLPKGVKT